MSHPGFEPQVPEDFDAFWQETAAEALAAPLDFRRYPQGEQSRDGFEIEAVSFRGIDGSTKHGWIAAPEGAHRLPSFLWIPPYSRWSMLPNEYGTRPGFVSMSLNFFGEGPFHQETYSVERGYFAEGVMEPSTFIFRRMAQDALIALRVMEAQSEVDENRMGASGMSQGAGMAMWLSTLTPKVRAVAADMPFFGALRWVFDQPVRRYPLKELVDAMDAEPLGRERAMYTFSYFDTLHFATRVSVPTLVTAGLKDPAVRPEQVRAIFSAMPVTEKELVEIDWGHDWHPSMIERNAAWLRRYLV
ncbi:MAG: acetylxylan esterase [Fimbriimonadaceae bacterium]|nr:acetylxylan esterase [Fimbriimonadaceae bacterium]